MANSRLGLRTRPGLIRSYTETTSGDSDANAFISAVGLTDATQKNAINQLVVDLKAYSIWTKMKAIYPFIGGTAAAHRWNLKDPRAENAAFYLEFFGGWTHASTGATPNGTTGYADTKLAASAELSLTNSHLSFYSRTNSSDSNSRVDIGRGAGTAGSYINLFTKINNVTNNIGGSMGNKDTVVTNSNGACYALITAISSTSQTTYNNGVSVATNTATSSGSLASTGNIFIGSQGDASGAAQFSNKECAFATIGTGLTDQEAANLYTAVQAFETTLGRQI